MKYLMLSGRNFLNPLTKFDTCVTYVITATKTNENVTSVVALVSIFNAFGLRRD
jgi:hypothetical protein